MAKRILAVDDSKTARQAITICLRNEGYEVIEATDGDDAIYKLEHASFSLIVSDYHMPKMNGIELAQKSKKINGCRFLPILMMTTEMCEEQIKDGKNAGVSLWMNKQRDMDRLPSLVRLLIGA